MNVDLSAATAFMVTHARLLDRRRFQLLMGETDPSGALAALDAYRNPDGGYGWGLEPDLRSPESQPADGMVHVDGGTEDEALRPLDFAPFPDRPARALFAPELISAELDRLAHMQEKDGGWTVDYLKISPAGALEWRGYATVRALRILNSST